MAKRGIELTDQQIVAANKLATELLKMTEALEPVMTKMRSLQSARAQLVQAAVDGVNLDEAMLAAKKAKDDASK